jgi:hypothetical protein
MVPEGFGWVEENGQQQEQKQILRCAKDDKDNGKDKDNGNCGRLAVYIPTLAMRPPKMVHPGVLVGLRRTGNGKNKSRCLRQAEGRLSACGEGWGTRSKCSTD